MNRAVWLWMVVLAALACAASARGLGGGRSPGAGRHGLSQDGGDNPNDKRPTDYVVVQERHPDGAITFEALPADKLAERYKELLAEYTDALKEWNQAKKDAEREGTKFTTPTPLKPFLQKYQDRVYKGERPAKLAAEKCQQKWDEQDKKKADKDPANKGDAGGAADAGDKAKQDGPGQ